MGVEGEVQGHIFWVEVDHDMKRRGNFYRSFAACKKIIKKQHLYGIHPSIPEETRHQNATYIPTSKNKQVVYKYIYIYEKIYIFIIYMILYVYLFMANVWQDFFHPAVMSCSWIEKSHTSPSEKFPNETAHLLGVRRSAQTMILVHH